MDRKALLDDLAMRLRQAAGSSNWRELKATDRELAALLPKIDARHAWTESEWAAFLALKRAHGDVREHCRREAVLYARRIAGMRATRIGWMAYALHAQSGGVRR
jgi:hypothetical protein